jgi:hypothetical protein
MQSTLELFTSNTGGLIKGKQGTLLATEKEQEKIKAKHFGEVIIINRRSPEETAVTPEATVCLHINTDPPTPHPI